MNAAKENIGFKIIYMLAGILAAAVLVLLPIKYGALLIGGAVFAVFAFFKLELSFGLFLMAMACAPHEYWNNIYIFLGAVFFAGVYALQYFSGKREGIDLKYLPASLIMYVFFCGISLFAGFGGMDSVRVFVILLGCVVFSVLATNIIRTEKQLTDLIYLISIAIALSALLGVYRYLAGIEIKLEFVDLTKNQGLSRLYSVMSNPNNDAEFWAMLLPFTIASVFITKCDVKRTGLAAMAAVCVMAFALTYSRSGYIALVAAAGVFILFVNPRLVPVCILALILMIPFVPSSIINRLMTIGKDTSSVYRLYIWEGVFRVIKNYWVQGIGMGPSAFTTIYRGYAHNMARPAMHAHNVLLNVWVETGIGGFLAIALYFFRVVKTGISSFLAAGSRALKYYSAAAVASFTAFFIFGIVEYVWFYPRVMLCFWLVSGLSFSIAKMKAGDK